jgi:hypothetical protein
MATIGGRAYLRELARYPQHCSRVVSRAVLEIWRDLDRAEQNKRNEHQPAVGVGAVAKSNKELHTTGKLLRGYLGIDTELLQSA